MRTIHVPCYSLSDPLPVLEGNWPRLKGFKSAGLVCTAQHINRLDDVAAFLRAKGMRVEVAGQILGCAQGRAPALDVECFVYIGSGRFHPIGLALKTDKPVFILNPLSGVLDELSAAEKRKWSGRRKGAMSRALESRTFGIMVSTKDGQFNLKKAQELKRKLKAKGKEAFIIAAEELSPGNLLPFKVDCWVNTACPRIAGDEYDRPVVNADELESLIEHL